MRSHPEIGIWELVSGTPCFGPHRILRGQNPLTAWYLGPNTSSLAVRVSYPADRLRLEALPARHIRCNPALTLLMARC